MPTERDQDPTVPDIGRYRSLGLIRNPFVVPQDADDDAAVASEVAAAGNVLMREILSRSREDSPRPLVVLKGDVPAFYPLQAVASIEPHLATDESLNVLYAYVPLFTVRIGVARATLGVVAERLAFRQFERTLSAYVPSILAEPDPELASFALLEEDDLNDFSKRLDSDGLSAIASVFGDGPLELHPELGQVADLRQAQLAGDGDDSDVVAELDPSIGDAPGAPVVAAESEKRIAERERRLFDYFAEYTSVHLSPVVARALRVYRDRGLAAASAELRITKAPRKTLAALLRLAGTRFARTAFLYDGFEGWLEAPADDRSAVVGALSELRWKTAGAAFPVFLVAAGEAPEVEETFGASGIVRWDFPGLVAMQDDPGAYLSNVVSRWLDAAALEDGARLDMGDPVLAALATAADGSMDRFIRSANAAVESAAARSLAHLDDVAREAGLDAVS